MQFGPLQELIARHVADGQTVALEGFTHLIPFAAGHEIIRQGRRALTLVRMTPDLIYDQMIGMGCASRLIYSWGGNPGVGSLHRLRDAVEHGWPAPLATDERSHAGMAASYQAGAAGLPFGVLDGFHGSDLPEVNPSLRFIECPFTGRRLAALPAINPDVTVIHAPCADEQGNVLLEGIIGIQKEAALAAKTLLVTVEEIVARLPTGMNAVVLPHWVVGGIAVVRGGAHPSYVHGRYSRDNAFYQAWDDIARDRDGFRDWMHRHVVEVRDHAGYLAALRRQVCR